MLEISARVAGLAVLVAALWVVEPVCSRLVSASLALAAGNLSGVSPEQPALSTAERGFHASVQANISTLTEDVRAG